jgi:hypothetical protein
MASPSTKNGASVVAELSPPESRKILFVSQEVASYFVGQWPIVLRFEGDVLIVSDHIQRGDVLEQLRERLSVLWRD